MTEPLPPHVQSLLAAVEHAPDDVVLRVHVAQVLLDEELPMAALEQCSKALMVAPGDPAALRLLQAITARIGRPDPVAPVEEPPPVADAFDWGSAEAQMLQSADPAPEPDSPASVERPGIRLQDVGGMEHVKQELRTSFLLPMANPALREAYGASLGGGLLLFGPPGCGKTYFGRALAGELGASFYAISLADVLEMYLGQSEKNLRAIFDVARAHRPSVIFFDEVDAIGQKRANLRANSAMRGTVNQLLSEMDGAQGANDGVFVLGASNQPWDIDTALRRPGRFDRTLFVPPPDPDARRSILRVHLEGRPLGAIDYDQLAAKTNWFSGADLARVCQVATRIALGDAARSGEVRPVEMSDLATALAQTRASTREWFATARNVVSFANEDGTYDELAAFMKANKL